MSQAIAGKFHQPTVRVAPQDPQTAQRASSSGLVTREYAIAAQKEILTEQCRQKSWAQSFCLDQGNRQKAESSICVEKQTRWQQTRQRLGWQRISQDQAMPKLSLDCEGMPFEPKRQ